MTPADIRRQLRPGLAMPVRDGRAAWLELLREVGALANRVRDGDRPDRVDAASTKRLVVTFKAAFPLRFVSAANAAEAFLILARGFIAAELPVATASFVAAGADCLERMIIDDGHAAAASGRVRMGDVD